MSSRITEEETSLTKIEVARTAYAEETMRVLHGCGCLLVSGDVKDANVMTIGWGLIGPLWGRHFFMVAQVRSIDPLRWAGQHKSAMS